jgi:hypothetical protein
MQRTITALLRRNKSHDGQKDYKDNKKITYTGFDICWPDGSPTNVNFARFCKIGIRSIFGRTPPQDKDYLVTLSLTPLPSLPPQPHPRILFLKKQGHVAKMFLHTGDETEFSFSNTDDPKVRSWIDFDNLKDNVPYWFEFNASNKEI